MKMSTCEFTWYADLELLEWWQSEDPLSRKTMKCNIVDAIELARKKKVLLVIQPELQDECIFVDYSKNKGGKIL